MSIKSHFLVLSALLLDILEPVGELVKVILDVWKLRNKKVNYLKKTQ